MVEEEEEGEERVNFFAGSVFSVTCIRATVRKSHTHTQTHTPEPCCCERPALIHHSGAGQRGVPVEGRRGEVERDSGPPDGELPAV